MGNVRLTYCAGFPDVNLFNRTYQMSPMVKPSGNGSSGSTT